MRESHPYPSFDIRHHLFQEAFLSCPCTSQVGVVTSEDAHSPTPTLYWDHLCLGFQHLLLANSGALGTDRTFQGVPDPVRAIL